MDNTSINVTEDEMCDLIEQAIREGKIKFEDEDEEDEND